MQQEAREYYDLESTWLGAARAEGEGATSLAELAMTGLDADELWEAVQHPQGETQGESLSQAPVDQAPKGTDS